MVFSRHPRTTHNLQSLYLLRLSLRSSVSSPSSELSKTRCPRLGVSHLAPCQCPLPPLCFQQLPTIKFSKSLVLITIRNAGGGGYPPCPEPRRVYSEPRPVLPPPEFRIFFQSDYLMRIVVLSEHREPKDPSAHSPIPLTKTAGVYGVSSQSGTAPKTNALRRGAISQIPGSSPEHPAPAIAAQIGVCHNPRIDCST